MKKNKLQEEKSSEIEKLRETGTVKNANDELEIKIQEKTADLVKANEELHIEIKEHKRAEDELRESERRLRLLSDLTTEGIVIHDKGIILDANDALVLMFGYTTVAELIGKSGADLMTPESQVLLWQHIETGSDKIYEAVGIKKSGRRFPIEIHGSNIKYKGKIVRTGVVRDLTEQKRAEEALRQSEDRFSKAFRNSPVALNIARLADGYFVDANESFLRLFEYTREEVIDHASTELNMYVDPSDHDQFIRILFEHGTISNYEVALRAKSGKLVRVLFSAEIISLNDQDHIISTLVDITERQRAEEALRESEQRWATTLASIGDAVISTDAEGRITFMNSEAEVLTGWMFADALAKPVTDVFKIINEYTRLTNDPVTRIIRYGIIVGLANHTILVRKDGKEIPIDDSGAPIRDGGGKIMGIVLVFRDITERRKVEEALSKVHDELELKVQERTAELGEKNIKLEAEIKERMQAEEKIREQATLLDNAQEAIGVRSLENRIIYWNKGAQRLYGWKAEEIIGKNPVEFLFKNKEEPPQIINAKKSVLENGEWTGEVYQVTKSGRELIIESHWTLIYDSKGKPKSILVINSDITEKKLFEAHLLRAQRMESIGTLAGGMAHNLNNMLTPMMMSLRMLKDKFKDENSQKLLTILEQNSQRSADLIKQVLSFSRGVEGERKPIHVNYIITEIEKIAKEIFPRNIEIRTVIPNDLLTVSGDITQLHQVIMNLCVNARDAMPDGGILSISAENFFVDENYVRMHIEAKVGSYIVITVSDTGIGIPPDIVDRIFEPFFTTKEFGKGTGLGLSTAIAIVKSHGGFINVDSEVGKGSKFRIYLPAILQKGENGQEEEEVGCPTGHGEWVLVAEDEDSVREVTVSTLKEYGYNVIAANDGAESVALYIQNSDKIKVVLMDLMMPIMDGEMSIRAIRTINPDVKFIVVSGFAETKIDSIVKAVLHKPYTAEILLKAMHEVLEE